MNKPATHTSKESPALVSSPEGLFDFLTTVAKVCTVGGAVLNQLVGKSAAASAGAAVPFTVGRIQWSVDPDNKRVYAYNAGDQDVVLNYSLVTQGGGSTLPRRLNAGTNYDASDDLIAFGRGDVQVVPVQESVRDGNPFTTAIGFSISALAIGASITMTGGVSAGFRRNQAATGYEVYVSALAPQILGHFRIRTGNSGTSLDFSGAGRPAPSATGSSPTVFVWPVPTSENLGDALGYFEMTLTLPSTLHDAMLRTPEVRVTAR
jgi:hypothetical protein